MLALCNADFEGCVDFCIHLRYIVGQSGQRSIKKFVVIELLEQLKIAVFARNIHGKGRRNGLQVFVCNVDSDSLFGVSFDFVNL